MKRHSANRTSAGLSWTQRAMIIGLAVLMIFTLSPGIVQTAAAAGIDPKLPPLKIAFIPFENPEQLVDNVGPALAFLEKQLGRKIRHFTTLNYSSAVEALNAGRADISFMSPLPYVLVNAQTGAQAILGEIYNGKSYYYSKIFVRKDSGIKTLADLKGKTIAYVDPISSSGFMYPHDILIRAGHIKGGFDDPEGDFFRRVYYAGGDEQAMRALYGKFVDAAGIGEFAINLLRQEERDEVVAIAESKRIPSHCVVARKGLDPKLKEQFIQAMLKLNAPENRKYVRYLYGTDGYVRVNQDTYRSVSDMARKYGFMK